MENASQPTGLDSLEKSTAPAGVVLPNLDDPEVIKDLLRAHAMAVSKRLAEAVHKNVSREEVVTADRRAAAFLAATLSGNNPAYEKAQVNTPASIEARLRKALSGLMEKWGIQAGEVKDSLVFLQVAMFAFTNELHELINELQKQPEKIESEGPVLLDRLLEKWTKMITKDRTDA